MNFYEFNLRLNEIAMRCEAEEDATESARRSLDELDAKAEQGDQKAMNDLIQQASVLVKQGVSFAKTYLYKWKAKQLNQSGSIPVANNPMPSAPLSAPMGGVV